jgi:hypothetical protein
MVCRPHGIKENLWLMTIPMVAVLAGVGVVWKFLPVV